MRSDQEDRREELDLLEGAFGSTGRIVAKVTPEVLGAPTPCADWDVRAVLEHATNVVAMFAGTASRTGVPTELPSDAGKWVSDPVPTFERVTKTTLAAWSEPGALEGTCCLPTGREVPASIAIQIGFIDALVHGWDLAKALDLDPTLDPALATAALEASRMIMSDHLRGPNGAFGAEVSVGSTASPTDQLVAFLGRRP
jgi:uncharacterized protein (TIGR03086 family)